MTRQKKKKTGGKKWTHRDTERGTAVADKGHNRGKYGVGEGEGGGRKRERLIQSTTKRRESHPTVSLSMLKMLENADGQGGKHSVLEDQQTAVSFWTGDSENGAFLLRDRLPDGPASSVTKACKEISRRNPSKWINLFCTSWDGWFPGIWL